MYTTLCTINRIWGLKQQSLQVNCHAWFHLHWLRWAVRKGKGAKNSKWKYMSPVKFEPTPDTPQQVNQRSIKTARPRRLDDGPWFKILLNTGVFENRKKTFYQCQNFCAYLRSCKPLSFQVIAESISIHFAFLTKDLLSSIRVLCRGDNRRLSPFLSGIIWTVTVSS